MSTGSAMSFDAVTLCIRNPGFESPRVRLERVGGYYDEVTLFIEDVPRGDLYFCVERNLPDRGNRPAKVGYGATAS